MHICNNIPLPEFLRSLVFPMSPVKNLLYNDICISQNQRLFYSGVRVLRCCYVASLTTEKQRDAEAAPRGVSDMTRF